ncbi:type II CAAX endopeptidase family protein [Thermococcus sp.]|uniref:CPBP family intramembrane glutamic endopeptidase n=1 Tax=Thermococcus sp. TaxID=35749 RepID=UPI00261F9CA3|nr:type II CAAX endopeptidase family protein [Thermococcus sp.]
MPMNPLTAFILAFLLYITHGLYLSGFIRPFQRRFGDIEGYWVAMSIFTVVFAVLITLLCSELYFVRWSFPLDYFLLFLSLSILVFLPAVFELGKAKSPEINDEGVNLVKSMGFKDVALFQIISAALPEELVFRYVLLGLLSLWNPFAGLIALSLFFGIGHRFSHPNRNWNVLISNALVGFVLGLAYLYTKSLLVVMVIHWLDDMIPWAYIKYEKSRGAIAGTVILLAILPLALLWGRLTSVVEYLMGIYSNEGLILGTGIAVAMLGVVYLGLKLLKGGE